MDDLQFDISSLSETEAWIVLLFLISDRDKTAKDLISEFESELIFKNRFSSNHPVIKELHICAPAATLQIKAGATYYRARIYHESVDPDNLLQSILRSRGLSAKQIKETLNEWTEEFKELLFAPGLSGEEVSHATVFPDRQELFSAVKKWKSNVRFKGYNAKESTAPPVEKIDDGRANPDHIRYLYLCEDKMTPVYEVRPIIGDYVSLAKFTLLEDIKLYDLTKKSVPERSTPEDGIPLLFDAIGALFSRPVETRRENYIATRFLAEEIKRMGFDGLRFESSLHRGGFNTVLFEPDKCKVLSSDIVHVNEIKIETEIPWFFNIDADSAARTDE